MVEAEIVGGFGGGDFIKKRLAIKMIKIAIKKNELWKFIEGMDCHFRALLRNDERRGDDFFLREVTQSILKNNHSRFCNGSHNMLEMFWGRNFILSEPTKS